MSSVSSIPQPQSNNDEPAVTPHENSSPTSPNSKSQWFVETEGVNSENNTDKSNQAKKSNLHSEEHSVPAKAPLHPIRRRHSYHPEAAGISKEESNRRCWKVVVHNFRALGGPPLELEQRFVDQGAQCSDDNAELSPTGLTFLRDLEARIAVLEEVMDSEDKDKDHGRVTELESMVKRIRGDISSLKGKTELDRQPDPQYATYYSDAWALFRSLMADTKTTELLAEVAYKFIELFEQYEMIYPQGGMSTRGACMHCQEGEDRYGKLAVRESGLTSII
ncbi:hypothetical protein J3R30DRAFT_3401588 [Lentinula aciculospora]|uniref:Uncharacterized protein n=1 Tax=Lentinula aciculospora TaxID=153920 RepID=A0A9W9ALW2_9AGAR|nr:hypothetical protein J3R30DRAFT_3401588 [Lentinula aciculospora]